MGALLGCSKPDTKNNAEKVIVNLPVIKPAPYISGENYDGKRITSKDVAGKYWLASFMFTTCPDICPRLNSQLSASQDKEKQQPVNHTHNTPTKQP